MEWRTAPGATLSFSALQRAEIAENDLSADVHRAPPRFSALQRAEIAENSIAVISRARERSFSALQRAEIAENNLRARRPLTRAEFQCSSTSRNC